MSLTATTAKQAKPKEKDYKLSDEKGLFLLVKHNGSKYWRLKYRYGGKEKSISFGVFPEITLKEARQNRDEARKQLSKGVDPSALRRSQKSEKAISEGNTFELVALEWFETKMINKSQSHQDRTLRALQKDLFPYLGHLPISEISPPQLLSVLRRIESRGAIETAHRARQTTSQIFRFAVTIGLAHYDPATHLTGALKTPKETHFAAITDPLAVGALLHSIEGYTGTATVQAALKLSPLFFCRPGELRHMEWTEINWESNQWEIPAEKMKMKQPHIVPLSKQAIGVLNDHRFITGNGKYVFPSARSSTRPLSENGVRTALRTMGYDNKTMTPHGFRAMARTLLDEKLNYRIDWIEHQLAHTVKDQLGRAYNRTQHLEGRKEMMQAWADYLDTLKKPSE